MEGTGLENELLSGEAEALPYEEVETDRANHNNDGQYGWVELDGKQCTNDYTSRAYGQQYCVGDTYTDPNGGTQTIRDIGFHGLDLAPNQWDAEETYADVGEKLGMSMEEWTEFSAEIQELNGNVDALKGNMFGPTEQERGRLGIRISNENPDWDEAQVMAEVDKVLEEKWTTSEAYAEAAAAETALFEKYGITKPNPGVYGTGTWVDEDGKYFRFESSSGNLWQTSQDDSFLDYAVPIGIGIGASLIAGGGFGSLFQSGGLLGSSGIGAVSQGAMQGVVGSAIGQGVSGNGIDPAKLLQAAMLGGLGGIIENLDKMDGSIMDNALMGGADSAVSKVSDMLNIGYDEALELVGGIAEGTIQGGDLESIVGGVVSNLGTVKIQDYLTEAFGDTVNVDDWFKDGQSHIPMEAFEPVIKGSIEAAIAGGMDAEDAIKMAWGYFDNGGDVDFMLPEFTNFLEGIPGLDFEKGDWSFGYDEESGDLVIGHNFPSFDFDLGEGVTLPELGNPCTTAEGQEGTLIGGALEGQWICNPTLPSFNIGDLCYDDEGNPGVIGKTGACDIEITIETPYNCEAKGAGWTWDNLVEECIPPLGDIETPYDCEKEGAGWTWDNLVEKCIPPLPDVGTPYDCEKEGAGWTWDNLAEKCIPPIKVGTPYDCEAKGAGWTWDNLAEKCVEINIPTPEVDVLDCMEGWEWSDLYEECVEIDFEIPEWEMPETPEWDLPEFDDIDIDLPDLPDMPEAPAPKQASSYEFTPTQQFAYTPVKGYTAQAPRQTHDYLQGKGLLK